MCEREYYSKNRKTILEKKKIYHNLNKDTINAYKREYNKNNKAEICIKRHEHYIKNKDIIGAKTKQYAKERFKHINGVLNPKSNVGFAIITEHIVFSVLNDCIKCNTEDKFCAEYDLISKSYGIINVKASKLNNGNGSVLWSFYKNKSALIPDYYICLGFNKSKTEILYVWIIPGTSNLTTKTGINIINSEKGLSRAIQYEVDPEPYNKAYQELDIYSLPEFCNLNKEVSIETNSETIIIEE